MNVPEFNPGGYRGAFAPQTICNTSISTILSGRTKPYPQHRYISSPTTHAHVPPYFFKRHRLNPVFNMHIHYMSLRVSWAHPRACPQAVHLVAPQLTNDACNQFLSSVMVQLPQCPTCSAPPPPPPPPRVGVRVGFATPELTVGESSQLVNITVQLTEGRLAVGVVVTIEAVGELAGILL